MDPADTNPCAVAKDTAGYCYTHGRSHSQCERERTESAEDESLTAHAESPMRRRGLFAGSFDPPTFGHLDAILRARSECDHLVVAVLCNEEKHPTFSSAERAAMLRRMLRGTDGITVLESDDLLVDVILRENVQVIFRGIRDEKDRAYEERQLDYHRLILPPPRFPLVHFLPARDSLREVSSSLVKSFVNLDVDVSSMVPRFIKAHLAMRLNGQLFLGVTGQMATGKSYVASRLVLDLCARGMTAHYVNLDELIRGLYAEHTPGAQAVRDELARVFGERVLIANRGDVDRTVLKAAVSRADADVRRGLHELTAPHVERLMRQAVRGKQGLVVVEWAQLCETSMDYLVNGNAVVVESPDHQDFLAARGATEFFEAMARAQWSADRKVEYLQAASIRHGCGRVWRYVNRRGQGVDGLVSEIRAWAQERYLNMSTQRAAEDEL